MTELHERAALPSKYNLSLASKLSWQRLNLVKLCFMFFPFFIKVVKTLGNRILGKLIARHILPAQNIFLYHTCDNIHREIEKIQNDSEAKVTIKRFEVPTSDSAVLDTIEIRPKGKDIDSLPYLIRFFGNSDCYENFLEEMILQAQRLGCVVIGSNYRGVSKSRTGKTKYVTEEEARKNPYLALEATAQRHVAKDAITQVKRLLDKGIPTHKIALLGHSMGGGAAVMAATHFYLIEKKFIKIFSDRSYSSITNVIVAWIRIGFGDKDIESSLGIFLGWLAKPIIKCVLTLADWEINAGKCFLMLPSSLRGYVSMQSPKKHGPEKYGPGDTTIPHYASIHEYLKEERLEKKNELRKRIAETELQLNNGNNQAGANLKQNLQTYQTSLAAIKSANKVVPLTTEDKHWTSLDGFVSRYEEQPTRDIFASFFNSEINEVLLETSNQISTLSNGL